MQETIKACEKNEYIVKSKTIVSSGGKINKLSIKRLLDVYEEKVIINALQMAIKGIDKEFSSLSYFVPYLGQFTRNYTQTVKRAADNKRRYAPGWVHSTCLLRGFPKGAAPHLAHDFAEQSVVCYTLCRRCPENTVAAGEGKGI